MQETLMAGHWVAVPKIWKRLPLMQETSMAGPLGGGAGDLGAPTINTRNVDGSPQAPE
jgi:hypothetical protein